MNNTTIGRSISPKIYFIEFKCIETELEYRVKVDYTGKNKKFKNWPKISFTKSTEYEYLHTGTQLLIEFNRHFGPIWKTNVKKFTKHHFDTIGEAISFVVGSDKPNKIKLKTYATEY